MVVDLGNYHFPKEVMETTLWPDTVMRSRVNKTVLIVELTVPWEEGVAITNV